jgi:hypothetical protein
MVFADPMMEETASLASTVLLLIWQTCLKSSTTSYTMASICSYFDNSASAQRPNPDRIILAPPSINPRPADPVGILIEPDEFKLNGKQYVRHCVTAKSQQHTRKRTSVTQWSGSMVRTYN